MAEPPPTTTRSALRTLIRRAMEVRGIRSVDGEQGLAKRAGVARNTIYAWEGGAYPRIGELERVARLLEVPTWQLLRAWEAGAVDQVRSTDDRLEGIERKLDLLLATGGIDPVDAEDEEAADRLLAAALARLEGGGRAAGES